MAEALESLCVLQGLQELHELHHSAATISQELEETPTGTSFWLQHLEGTLLQIQRAAK